jgi:molybdate/tungstate transport system substrate-binding protein
MDFRHRWWTKILLLTFPLLALVACNGSGEKIRLKVLIAGSLIVPFQELEEVYEEAYPEVDVQVEAHGSIQVIRHITEIHDLVDVVVPADYALIPMLMYSDTVPETDEPYADWFVKFASNRLALAYTKESRYADEINDLNWFEIITRSDVMLGLSDPRFDASGYRTLMIVQLAEDVYKNPTIFEQIFLGQFKSPLNVKKTGQNNIIHVPEVLEPTEEATLLMRGSSIALIALLESGDIDYAFEYESVIKQHGLDYVALPDRLNMGNPDLESYYATVEVDLDFQRFLTVDPEFIGTTIGYGVTIPCNAPHPELAEDFVAFLLGPEGQDILRANEHPPLEVPEADGIERMPDRLKSLCSTRP